jgi:hypothetical protein
VVDEHVWRAPATGLRPFVSWYTGYRQAGVAPRRHRGLPSGWLTFIVTLDDPLFIDAHPDPRQPAAAYDTLLGGLHTSPALVAAAIRPASFRSWYTFILLPPIGAALARWSWWRPMIELPGGSRRAGDYQAALVGDDYQLGAVAGV